MNWKFVGALLRASVWSVAQLPRHILTVAQIQSSQASGTSLESESGKVWDSSQDSSQDEIPVRNSGRPVDKDLSIKLQKRTVL